MEKHMKISMSYIKSSDGGYVGFINEINGVISQGETLKELQVNLIDALKVMFKFNIEIGRNNIKSEEVWTTRKMPICV